MRGLTSLERIELAAIPTTEARVFDGPALDALEACRRIERYDIDPDGSHRLRLTELGALALKLRIPPG